MNELALLKIFGPILATGWGFLIWYFLGRDYIFDAGLTRPKYNDQKGIRRKGLFESEIIPSVYHPIDGLTPGEAGLIIDRRVDDHDVVAEILYLVAEKYIKLTPINQYKRYFHHDYQFEQLKNDYVDLPEQHKLIMQMLFKNSSTVKFSEIVGNVGFEFNLIKQAIITSAHNKGVFIDITEHGLNNFLVVWLGFALFWVLLLGELAMGVIVLLTLPVIMLGFAYQREKYRLVYGYSLVDLLLIGGAFLLFPLVIMFAYETLDNSLAMVLWQLFPVAPLLWFGKNMTSKSALETYYHLQAKGLKNTLIASSWRNAKQEADRHFTKLFAYAVAFDLVRNISSDLQSLAFINQGNKQLTQVYVRLDDDMVSSWSNYSINRKS